MDWIGLVIYTHCKRKSCRKKCLWYYYNNINFDIERSIGMDLTALTTALSLTAFTAVIEDILPIVGVAVLVGFLFYVVRWGIGLFRGI